ncbi:LLM class flavin-dependent oxidoreductase [Mesorhizobium sp. M0904]|uniref:LLM class flavin-dependent oxidoreductase n=1 Tax=Mesorhizobium sp. M0904 TaxID=2957022 RepID=UPI0033355F0F
MADGATMCLAVSLSPEAAPSHPPGAGPDFSLLARFVQEAEAAGLDMVLLGDSAPVASGPNRQMRFEATTLLAALATVTSRIGLVARRRSPTSPTISRVVSPRSILSAMVAPAGTRA